MTVEGFSNYATFGVAVAIDNDQDAVYEVAQFYRGCIAFTRVDENVIGGIWTAEQSIQFRFADTLQDYVERLNDAGIVRSGNLASLLSSGLAQAGLAEVAWAELADHWTPES